MNQGSDKIILRIEKKNDKLQLSCFEQGAPHPPHHPRPVRDFLEQAPSEATLKEQTQQIRKILCRMDREGRPTPEDSRQLEISGQILYDELFPLKIKERLHGLEYPFLSLEIDEGLNYIPWELLFDGEDFLCRRFALGRIVHTRQVADTSRFPPRLKEPPLRLLLLCDPKGDLSKTEKESFWGEAQRSFAGFGDRRKVKIDLKSRPMEKATVRRYLSEYDIIHYAGHADYNQENPEQSGWELANGKFVAGDLGKMTGDRKSLPMLVFSNVCRSGREENDYRDCTFSLARIFLVSGVRHYIGTFGDILNKESAEFASMFYHNLFAGEPVGQALQNARISSCGAGKDRTALWMSYILYGDPSVSYVKKTRGPDRPEHENKQPAPSFAETRIRGVLADSVDSPAVAEVHDRVEELKKPSKSIPWGKMAKAGAVAIGIPSIFGLLGFGLFNYFYPRKVHDFLARSKMSSAVVSRRHSPRSGENRELDERFAEGDILIAQGKNLEAQALFTRLLQSDTLGPGRKSMTWNRLGRLYAGSNRPQEALKAFRQAIEADPDNYESYVNNALIFRDQGNWTAAMESVKAALERHPDDVIAKTLQQELKRRLGLERDKARK